MILEKFGYERGKFGLPHKLGKGREGNVAEIRESNKALIAQLRESKGTDPVRLFGNRLEVAMKFLERMHAFDMPGSVEIPIGEGRSTRAYFIGVTECPDRPERRDEDGPYHLVFGPQVAFCEGGEGRTKIREAYVGSAFGVKGDIADMEFGLQEIDTADFMLEGEAFSDIAMPDAFCPGFVRTDNLNNEPRFYPMPLENVLDNLMDENLPEGNR
ncbi:MAG TPA: hypothetical protein VFX86_04565 [Candidatus Saccharimonadales bacterium]|nr:hypothetical protein [Candidatus Saccharimonadales bacterium]